MVVQSQCAPWKGDRSVLEYLLGVLYSIFLLPAVGEDICLCCIIVAFKDKLQMMLTIRNP